MTRPRNQHYVPELHLKHFIGAEPKGMVWTYDNQTGTVRRSIPRETGFQRNYYSVLGEEEGQYDDSIEEWLSGVETQCHTASWVNSRGLGCVTDDPRAFLAKRDNIGIGSGPTSTRRITVAKCNGKNLLKRNRPFVFGRFASNYRLNSGGL